jgi:hypothetical protein
MALSSWRLGTCAALFVLVITSASASPIFVSNPSFETLPSGGLTMACTGAGCAFAMSPIPGWTNTAGNTGQLQPGTNTMYFNSVPDGNVVGFTFNNGTISQNVGTVTANTQYTLTVDVGLRSDLPGSALGIVELLIGNTIITATGTAPTPGNWSVYTATYHSTAADAGKTLGITLTSTGNQGDFDKVALDGTAIPEPATTLLAGLGAIALAAFKRKRT